MLCRIPEGVASAPRLGGDFKAPGHRYDPGTLLPVYNEVEIYYGADDF